MVTDPYKKGLIRSNLFVKKEQVRGRLVAVLRGQLENRGLELIKPPSRVVNKDEIHELILTHKPPLGNKVHSIAYLGFFVVDTGGVILKGDKVLWQDQGIGELLGYDSTHLPNHMNIIILGQKRLSGEEMGLSLGDTITFSTPREEG